MVDHDQYLIWSNEHQAWWKPGCFGYSRGVRKAGRFSREMALRICREAIPQAGHIGIIAEIPVRLLDVQEFLAGTVGPAVIMGDDTEDVE